MRKNDPTTYPRWLSRMLTDMENEVHRCQKEAQECKAKYKALPSMTEYMNKANWTKEVRPVPGGFDIIISVRGK